MTRSISTLSGSIRRLGDRRVAQLQFKMMCERPRAAEGGRGSLTRHLEWLTNALECTECLLEIGDQVFDVFDSYGETHKPVRNT
jgi:hypothetical protein